MKKKTSNFHSSNLEYIKRVTGASFCGFEQYRDKYQLVLIKDGRRIECPLNGTPDDITYESYKKLLDGLIYGESNENVEAVFNKLGTN